MKKFKKERSEKMKILKEMVKTACDKRNISVSKLLMLSNIQSGDYYQAINGKKPFFDGWKKRIAETLNLSIEELFPINEINECTSNIKNSIDYEVGYSDGYKTGINKGLEEIIKQNQQKYNSIPIETRYLLFRTCIICGRLCRGERGYKIHRKIHKGIE